MWAEGRFSTAGESPIIWTAEAGEPVSGVARQTAAECAAVIERLRSLGAGVVLIEHDMRIVEQLCTRVVVLHAGRVIASGTMDEVRSERAVVESYLN